MSVIKLSELCLSVLPGNTKTAKWNVTRNQKLKAVQFYGKDIQQKEQERKPSQPGAMEPADAKSFYGLNKKKKKKKEWANLEKKIKSH